MNEIQIFSRLTAKFGWKFRPRLPCLAQTWTSSDYPMLFARTELLNKIIALSVPFLNKGSNSMIFYLIFILFCSQIQIQNYMLMCSHFSIPQK